MGDILWKHELWGAANPLGEQADLSGMHIKNIDLSNVWLEGVISKNSIYENVRLNSAWLCGGNFDDSAFKNVSFDNAHMSLVGLSGIDCENITQINTIVEYPFKNHDWSITTRVEVNEGITDKDRKRWTTLENLILSYKSYVKKYKRAYNIPFIRANDDAQIVKAIWMNDHYDIRIMADIFPNVIRTIYQ